MIIIIHIKNNCKDRNLTAMYILEYFTITTYLGKIYSSSAIANTGYTKCISVLIKIFIKNSEN